MLVSRGNRDVTAARDRLAGIEQKGSSAPLTDRAGSPKHAVICTSIVLFAPSDNRTLYAGIQDCAGNPRHPVEVDGFALHHAAPRKAEQVIDYGRSLQPEFDRPYGLA